MRKIALLAAALSLCGCAATESFLNDPAAQTAVQNAAADLQLVQSALAPIACAISDLGGQKTTRYAVSSVACVSAGGAVR